MHCSLLLCAVLYYVILHYLVLCYVVLYVIVICGLYWTVPYCTVLHCLLGALGAELDLLVQARWAQNQLICSCSSFARRDFHAVTDPLYLYDPDVTLSPVTQHPASSSIKLFELRPTNI